MALYHKHRPQTFASLWGQEHIIQTITNQIKNKKLAHAYLFSGPRGVGKTTTARLLAKAANCRNRKEGEFEPCDACDSCNEISESRSIDVMEMDAASHTGVDNVREQVIENARTQPTKSKYKIFIVDEVHMLSTSAFNALLKTLEEPPEFVIFILATTELNKLPDTIISRCQRFDFKRLPADAIKKQIKKIAKIEGVEIDSAVIERIAYKSDGCDRDAISLLDQLLSTGEKNITAEVASLILPVASFEGIFELAKNILLSDSAASLQSLNSLIDKGSHPFDLSEEIISFLRMILVSHYDLKAVQAYDFSDEIKKGIQELKSAATPDNLLRLIDIFLKRRGQIKTSPLPQLPLEMAIIEFVSSSEAQPTLTAPKPTKKLPESAKPAEPEKLIDASAEKKIEVEKVTPPAPKKTIIEKVKEFVSAEQVCKKEDAEKALGECMKIMETDSPTLISILKLVSVVDVRGNTIHLTVPFQFHQDRLSSGSYHQKVCESLSKILGTTVNIDVDIAEKPPADAEIQNLAAAFGGEVV